MCLCLPSSVSWYLARAFMSCICGSQLHESNEQGEYCRSGSAASWSLGHFANSHYINYLLYFTFTLPLATACSHWHILEWLAAGMLPTHFDWKTIALNIWYFNAKWAQKCQFFSNTITTKSIYHHAKHIGLHSLLCNLCRPICLAQSLRGAHQGVPVWGGWWPTCTNYSC